MGNLYMKDSWRVSPRVTIPNEIGATKVTWSSSDNCNQGTRKYGVQGGNCAWFSSRANHIHRRAAFDTAVKPLDYFKSSRHLVSILLDTLKAHRDVYEKYGLLHGDISVGNILIGGSCQGLLVDCDPARTLVTTSDGEGGHERMGSWKFVSSILLHVPSKFRLLQDDLESFFHVLMYVALRYIPNNQVNNLGNFMKEYFDDKRTRNADGTVSQCSRKLSGILSEEKIKWEGSLSLTSLVNVLRIYIKEWVRHEAAALPQLLVDDKLTKLADVPRHLALSDHSKFIEFCEIVLECSRWPEDDKVDDQLRVEGGGVVRCKG